MSHPRWIINEANVLGPLRPAGGGAKTPPLAVVAYRQHQPRIGRGEQLIRHDLKMGVALARRCFAAAQVGLRRFTCDATAQSNRAMSMT